ncbi:MAG TPA: LptF/LptG family permease, partial [Pyrinomonadaceae bacterium]|nr:LptF/LptG family permease [Pyrinomonadaceae bacterium]
MKQFGWIISKYLIKTILPYFIFSWLLLSVVIFFQQASRFSEILFSTTIPKNLIWQLTLALVPNVIAFTCPMAVLVGVIIGLSKMQGDSELTAIRAAGVGNLQITIPIAILGILLSLFAFMVNLRGVPFAAQIVRGVALQTALYKLESPIEPGVFNTELAGFTIYVKEGNFQTGNWENIFIYNEDKAGNQARLITSKIGRIDSKDELSELVLENAVVHTFPINYETSKPDKFISENVRQIRFGIKTKRGELIENITNGDKSLEEFGLNELAEIAQSKEGKERTEAELLLQRRLILSITPLIFALLGTALVLRFNRGGRGFGIFLALVSLVGYYLITLLGEQLARTGTINVLSASLIPLIVSAVVIIWLFWSNKSLFNNPFANIAERFNFKKSEPNKISKGNLYLDLTTGILDYDIVTNLLKYFLLTLGFLTSIFLIFTAFELWKFAGVIDGGVWLLGKYLFYLLPFIYIQIAPSALMVAILATFVIKSRQNEIVTWTSAGQSVYRLLFPCFILMLVVGGLNFALQEYVFPNANKRQDELRGQIRGGGILSKKDGKIWSANDKKIYSFELGE